MGADEDAVTGADAIHDGQDTQDEPERNESDGQDGQDGQDVTDGQDGQDATPDPEEQTLAEGEPSALALAATMAAPTLPLPPRTRRRYRLALGALSALLLVASIVATVTLGYWNPAGGLTGLGSPFGQVGAARAHHPLASNSTPNLNGLPDSTVTDDTLSLGNHLPTPLPTATKPPNVGDGIAYTGGTWPAYTGPVSAGQGCPSGQAPKPVSWAIRGASDYNSSHLSEVALTFDDGPTPYSSPAILSYLEQTHTPATFFVLGQYANAYPWLVQREAADGFTIGVHTWSHPDMRLLTPAQRAWQFSATVQQLHADLGANFCIWLWRPPYGSYDTSIIQQAGSFGLTTIMWNDDPADWSRPGTMTIVQRVLSYVRPGSIILMHDGPAARQETADALPYILAGLKARGLTPVSLPQLLLGYNATVTPTATATASPTATVTASPTVTDTPTATATATSTATATATATATSTATVAPTATTSALGAWYPWAEGGGGILRLGIWYRTLKIFWGG